jgi:hypothetical protein
MEFLLFAAIVVGVAVAAWRWRPKRARSHEALPFEPERPRREERREPRQDARMVSPARPPPRAGFTHWIEYADALGEVTSRSIRVLSVQREAYTGILYVTAYCGLRHEERTFRADRMLRLSELPSGRAVAAAAAYFAAYPGVSVARRDEILGWPAPPDPYAGLSIPKTHERVMERARGGLRGLIWLAAADGEMSESEIEVLLDWVAFRAAAGRQGPQAWSREAARIWIRNERPIFADTRTAIGRMGRAEAARFIATMDALMLADGAKTRLEEGRAARLRACLPPRAPEPG